MAKHIQFLTWSGCPSHDDALRRLHEVLDQLGRPDQPVDIEWVETDEDARRLSFVGSPTFRVDGEDVVDPGDAQTFALTCRVYTTHSGRFSPLPDREQLASRLEALLREERS